MIQPNSNTPTLDRFERDLTTVAHSHRRQIAQAAAQSWEPGGDNGIEALEQRMLARMRVIYGDAGMSFELRSYARLGCGGLIAWYRAQPKRQKAMARLQAEAGDNGNA